MTTTHIKQTTHNTTSAPKTEMSKRTVDMRRQVAAFLKSPELRDLFTKSVGNTRNIVSLELGFVEVPVEEITFEDDTNRTIVVLTDPRHMGWLLKVAVSQFGETQVFEELAKIARECGIRQGHLTCLDLIKSNEKIQRIQIVKDTSRFSESVFANIELQVTMEDFLVKAKKVSPKKTSTKKFEPKPEPEKVSKNNQFALLSDA